MKTLKFTNGVNLFKYVDVDEDLAHEIVREFRNGGFDSIVFDDNGREIKIKDIKDVRFKKEIKITL